MSEGLAQGPYVAARAGFELKTLRSKGFDSTNAPPRPTVIVIVLCQAESLIKICCFCSVLLKSKH